MNDIHLLSSTRAKRHAIVTIVVMALLGVVGWVVPPGGATQLFQMLLPAEAAILGIVVSVTFLSLQISSNQYAPLLSRLYRDDTFTGIIDRFGIAILVDIVFIVIAPVIEPSPVTRGLAIAVVSGLATQAFLSVFTIESQLEVFLNPEPVLTELTQEVSLERYQRFTQTHREEGRITRNPLLEIYQIATTSLEKHDNYGAIRAVDALGEATEQIFSAHETSNEPGSEDVSAPIHKVFTYWDDLALATTETGADDVLHAIIDTEVAITKTLVDSNQETLPVEAVRSVIYYYEVVIDTGTPHHADKLEDLLEASITAGRSTVTRELIEGIDRLHDSLGTQSGPFRGDRRAFAAELFQYALSGWIVHQNTNFDDDFDCRIELETTLVNLGQTWFTTAAPESAHVLQDILARTDELAGRTDRNRLMRLAIAIGSESENESLVLEPISTDESLLDSSASEGTGRSPIDEWFETVRPEVELDLSSRRE